MEIKPFDFARQWPQYCALHLEATGDPVDQVYLKWKYQDNPAGPALAFGAWEGDRLMGFAALIPRRFAVQGQECTVGMGEDLADPGRGREEAVQRLTERLLEEMPARGWLWRYGMVDSGRGGIYLERLGHRQVAEMPCLMKFRPGQAARRMLGIVSGRRETSGFRMAYHSYKVRMVREFDRRFDDLWERCRSQHPILPAKSSDHLNWRYFGHPNAQCQALTVEDEGRLKGFAVLAGGDLVDLLCEVDTDAYKTLGKAVEKLWRPSGHVVSLACVLGDRLADEALSRAGWKKRPGWHRLTRARGRKMLAVFPSPGSELASLGAKGGNWRLGLGDVVFDCRRWKRG
jgi:hypothetical protein